MLPEVKSELYWTITKARGESAQAIAKVLLPPNI